MLRSSRLPAFLTLGLLARWVVSVPAPRSDSSISWGDCEAFGINSTDPNFQCGYLEVPMDYHDSSAGQARLAVTKYAATASKKLGSVFFNPGGPGVSGTYAATHFGQTFNKNTQGLFDFISWDPRGVGNTFPGEVHCFTDIKQDSEFWQNTVAKGINETISGKFNERDLEELYSQTDLTEQKLEAFAADCQNGPSGSYLKYIGTSSTVRDLVSLGDAIVGQGEPIDYWGISYGTVVGFNFIKMFPERAGHVILDGVVDPNIWASYKFLQPSLADSEKTYSGLTDGCAKAGRAGCKLVEITGDAATGDDVKALINYAIDVDLELYRQGYEILVNPMHAKGELYSILYTSTSWSENVNSYVYAFVATVLQVAQAHNVAVPGGRKYNIPSGNFTADLTGGDSTPTLTSYSQAAIAGADDFADGDVTVKDVFDIIVSNTREVSSTFGAIWALPYTWFRWPVRSVEQLPPYIPTKLKTPVLVIGNLADPVTPLASAQVMANLLGDNAFLIEQLGFGHTSTSQPSSCTTGIMANYFINSVLPEGQSIQCPVDNSDLFPPLNGTTAADKRSNVLRRRF